jgi:cysteine desulfurase
MMNRIYLDHAATTAVSPEVLREMLPFMTECFGNAASIHGTGREAHRALDRARKQIAAVLGAQPQEIYFTSGGSESDNWAVKGVAWAARGRGKHVITSAVEHHAVLNACAWLEGMGFEVTRLPVDALGRVDPDSVARAVRPDTVLISVMTANNEIGTLQPIREIGEIARSRGVPFHTDAVQAAGHIPVNVEELQVDLLSLSAHKFHGPKGVGVLYVRRGTKLDSLIHGGAQERGLRAGTPNVPGAVGLAKALDLAAASLPESADRVRALRDQLIREIRARIPDAVLNGDPERRLPGNVHFSFPGVDGEALLLRLDLAGIACSGGSACTSGAQEPSHVLAAIGQAPDLAKGGLRMTLGEENTPEEIKEVLRVLPEIVQDLKRF